MYKAVMFDMGGVLLRTFDPAPREALAQRYGVTLRRLFDIIFTSESSQQAERGEKSDADHWNWALDQLQVAPEDRADFIRQWWAGDRMDYDLLEFINNLRPAVRTGLLSNAWPGTRANITKHWGSAMASRFSNCSRSFLPASLRSRLSAVKNQMRIIGPGRSINWGCCRKIGRILSASGGLVTRWITTYWNSSTACARPFVLDC